VRSIPSCFTLTRCLALSLVLRFLGFPVSADTLDRVVASVNEAVITNQEINRRMNEIVRFYSRREGPTKGKVPPREVVRRQALDQLIDEELLLQRSKGAFRENAAEKIAQREVEYYLEAIQRELGEEGFLARLASENQTVEEFRSLLAAERKRQNLVRQARQSWIDEFLLTPVSQSQLDEYLEEHPELKEKLEAQLILLRVDPETSETVQSAARKRAVRVLNLARAGEPFEELVAQYSQHEQSRANAGVIQLDSPTVPFPEFAPVFDLDVGQVYPELLRIPAGWCVVRATSKDSLHKLTRRAIAEEEFRKGLKKLRDKATIIYDQDLFIESTR
jgi:peptidyl-prolyl cis-trans isomerase SurA